MIWWAVGGAAVAVWLLARPPGEQVLRRLTVTPVPLRARPRWWLVLGLVPLIGLGLWAAASALIVAGTLLGAAVAYLIVRRRREAKERTLAKEVARACRVMSALLGQGNVPQQALIQASEECSLLAPAAAVARMGGDVPPALRQLGDQPGAGGLIEVARAWQIAESTGAGLQVVLERVKESLIRQSELAEIIAQEVAGPRASGQLLAALPLAGLALGAMIGADPLGFLTGTIAGRLCLIAGIALVAAGAIWSEVLTQVTPRRKVADERRRRVGARRRRDGS